MFRSNRIKSEAVVSRRVAGSRELLHRIVLHWLWRAMHATSCDYLATACDSARGATTDAISHVLRRKQIACIVAAP